MQFPSWGSSLLHSSERSYGEKWGKYHENVFCKNHRELVKFIEKEANHLIYLKGKHTYKTK